MALAHLFKCPICCTEVQSSIDPNQGGFICSTCYKPMNDMGEVDDKGLIKKTTNRSTTSYGGSTKVSSKSIVPLKNHESKNHM